MIKMTKMDFTFAFIKFMRPYLLLLHNCTKRIRDAAIFVKKKVRTKLCRVQNCNSGTQNVLFR